MKIKTPTITMLAGLSLGALMIFYLGSLAFLSGGYLEVRTSGASFNIILGAAPEKQNSIQNP